MRIIAGNWGGTRLTAPTGNARPTTDRVKESMFHLMGLTWSGGTVLDLFAGSGALGLEALSRGADRAVFVDKSQRSLMAVRENLQKCHVDTEQFEVWQCDWRQALHRIALHYPRVSWIFLDPPYGENLWGKVLGTIDSSGLAVDDGIVCEHPRDHEMPLLERFTVCKSRSYGDIGITLYVPSVNEVEV